MGNPPDQIQLLLDLQHRTVLQAAGDRGLQPQTIRAQVRVIARIIDQIGGHSGPILLLVCSGRRRESAWSELSRAERGRLDGLFGEADLALPRLPRARFREAFRRRSCGA